MEMDHQVRHLFRRWPWLMPVALVVSLPLFIAAGVLEGMRMWRYEAREYRRMARKGGSSDVE